MTAENLDIYRKNMQKPSYTMWPLHVTPSHHNIWNYFHFKIEEYHNSGSYSAHTHTKGNWDLLLSAKFLGHGLEQQVLTTITQVSWTLFFHCNKLSISTICLSVCLSYISAEYNTRDCISGPFSIVHLIEVVFLSFYIQRFLPVLTLLYLRLNFFHMQLTSISYSPFVTHWLFTFTKFSLKFDTISNESFVNFSDNRWQSHVRFADPKLTVNYLWSRWTSHAFWENVCIIYLPHEPSCLLFGVSFESQPRGCSR